MNENENATRENLFSATKAILGYWRIQITQMLPRKKNDLNSHMYFKNWTFSKKRKTKKKKKSQQRKIKGVLWLCLAVYSKMQEEAEKLRTALFCKKNQHVIIWKVLGLPTLQKTLKSGYSLAEKQAVGTMMVWPDKLLLLKLGMWLIDPLNHPKTWNWYSQFSEKICASTRFLINGVSVQDTNRTPARFLRMFYSRNTAHMD